MRTSPDKRPIKKLPRLAAVAVLAGLSVTACTSSAETTAERLHNEPAATATPDIEIPAPTYGPKVPTATEIQQWQARHQEKLNETVEKVLSSTFKDLPEKVEQFQVGKNMSFHQYHTEGYNAPDGRPYQRILSQTKGPDVPGTTEPSYSFLISYLDNADGSRSYDHINLLRVNRASNETMDNPELQGFQVLNSLNISAGENGNWSVSYEDAEKNLRVEDTAVETANIDELLSQVQEFDNILTGMEQ